MPKNLGKVLLCLGIGLGNFVPFKVLVTFATQLYVQFGYDKLGLFIMVTSSFSSVISSLLAPAFILRFGVKRIIVLTSFGITYSFSYSIILVRGWSATFCQ